MFDLMTIAIAVLLVFPFAVIVWFICALVFGGIRAIAHSDKFKTYQKRAFREPLTMEVEIATTGRNAIYEEKDENGILK